MASKGAQASEMPELPVTGVEEAMSDINIDNQDLLLAQGAFNEEQDEYNEFLDQLEDEDELSQ